jgi:3-phenylpropionate/trans-cinnamate dioxygenase ferredoxin subunit
VAEYIPVTSAGDIVEGSIRGFVVGDKEIAIARCEGELYAVDAICSHQYAYLPEGEVDTDLCVIECPLHGASFSLRTGRVRALPATEPIKTYPVRVTDEVIEVAIDV